MEEDKEFIKALKSILGFDPDQQLYSPEDLKIEFDDSHLPKESRKNE